MAQLPVQQQGFQAINRRRNSAKSKAWIALFVCMCTKAVHIELVTSLSTNAFFSALDRFIARRGLPARIYSDQGSNFLGAARKLRELYAFLTLHQQEISDHLTSSQIEWRFNPPSTPHFGGLWEAAIKSTKHHLHAVLQDQALTYEEFNTLLNRIESVLNLP
ncbi:integrase catalytic domain-containing protein, partial [Klebsiella pneumoniae]|uniref:integrase catalytic domain-containing protein n=1 Tax=Klebsiella pneumoniae TaxID=573 RepID=UPI0040558A1F